MITRAEILTNETYWIETIQNKIYSDLVTFINDNHISQKEIADRLKVSKGYISQILNGNNLNFRLETLVKICLAIGKLPVFSLVDKIEHIRNEREEDFRQETYVQKGYHIETIVLEFIYYSFNPDESSGVPVSFNSKSSKTKIKELKSFRNPFYSTLKKQKNYS